MSLAALDVPYETLPDWISARQVVKGRDGKAWLKDLRRVRAKLDSAVEDLLRPSSAAAVLARHERVRRAVDACCLPTLSDPTGRSTCADHVLFGDAREIFDALLEAAEKDEADATSSVPSKMTTAKSFLGYYSDPHLAAWDAVVRDFNKNNLFIAEGARALVQDCKYEVVALRATLDKSEKRVAEIDRRVDELQRASYNAERELVEKCVASALLPALPEEDDQNTRHRKDKKKKKKKSNNRKGPNARADPEVARARARQARELDFESQLVARVGSLGRMLRDVHASCKNDALQEACNYYLAFSKFVHGQKENAEADRLACLRRLILSDLAEEEGKTGVHQEAESAIDADFDASLMMAVEGSVGASDADAAAADMVVDWGIEDAAATGGEGGTHEEAVEIDWGGGGDEAAAGGDSAEIDWGLNLNN